MDTHPGFATDLLFNRYQGEVVRHDQFWAVRTPDAPDYYFGNYLLLPNPPSDRDKGWLEATFDQLIGQDPRVRHRTFQWPLAVGQTAGSPVLSQRVTNIWSAWCWRWMNRVARPLTAT